MQKLLVQVVIVALVVRCAVSQSCSLDTNGTAVKTVDVLILGAGISGIAAARTLEVNGVTDFLVIEATDRIGGRIREYDGIDRVGLEVGANWIQGLDENDKPRHPIWREWLRCEDQGGPDGSYTPDDFTYVYNARDEKYNNIEDYKDIKREFELAYCEAVGVGKTIGISDDISLEKALEKKEWATPADPLHKLVEWEGVDFCSAIQPRNISVFHHSRINYTTDFLKNKFDDAKNYLMADKKGYSYVVGCLAKNFMDHIQLNSMITKIQTADDCVCVTVEKNDLYCGRYSIVTFSIGVLQASIDNEKSSVFRFEPPLPQWKQDALNTIIPVHYGKIHLQFDTKFWKDTIKVNDTHQQIIIGHASDTRGDYPYFIFDNNRPYTITADVTEGLAEKVARQSKMEKPPVIDDVMNVLKNIFPNAKEPRNAILSNWSIDPLFLYVLFQYSLPKHQTISMMN